MKKINLEAYLQLVGEARKKDPKNTVEKSTSSRGGWYGYEPFALEVERADVGFKSETLNKIIQDEFNLIAFGDKEGAKYLYEDDEVLLDAYGAAEIEGLLGKKQSRNANMFIPLGCMNAVYRKPITGNHLELVVVMRSHDMGVAGLSDLGVAAKIWDFVASYFGVSEGKILFIDLNPHFYTASGVARKAKPEQPESK